MAIVHVYILFLNDLSHFLLWNSSEPFLIQIAKTNTLGNFCLIADYLTECVILCYLHIAVVVNLSLTMLLLHNSIITINISILVFPLEILNDQSLFI